MSEWIFAQGDSGAESVERGWRCFLNEVIIEFDGECGRGWRGSGVWHE